MTPQQIPLPIVARPVGEIVCEYWRKKLGTKAPQPKVKK